MKRLVSQSAVQIYPVEYLRKSSVTTLIILTTSSSVKDLSCHQQEYSPDCIILVISRQHHDTSKNLFLILF